MLRGRAGGDRGSCGGRMVVVVVVSMGWVVGGLVARVVLSLGLARVGLGLRLEAGLSGCDWVV